MIATKPQARSRLATALRALKSKLLRSKAAPSHSQPLSTAPTPAPIPASYPVSLPQAPITYERRYVQGLGQVRADAMPRRSRQAVVEAKVGNSETKNEVMHASAITTIGGFVYDRECIYGDEVRSDVSAGIVRSGVVSAARLPTITTVHAAVNVMPMSGVIDIWEAQEAVVEIVHSASCQIA